MTDKPEIVLGTPRLVTMPRDPRPAYHSWWHVPCLNHQRGSVALRVPNLRTKDAADCRAFIEFTADGVEPRREQSCFVIGPGTPPDTTTLRVGEEVYIPVYLTVASPLPHPLYGRTDLPPGTYATGLTFIWHPGLVATTRLTPAQYTVTVTLQWQRESVTSTFPLMVEGSAPP